MPGDIFTHSHQLSRPGRNMLLRNTSKFHVTGSWHVGLGGNGCLSAHKTPPEERCPMPVGMGRKGVGGLQHARSHSPVRWRSRMQSSQGHHHQPGTRLNRTCGSPWTAAVRLLPEMSPACLTGSWQEGKSINQVLFLLLNLLPPPPLLRVLLTCLKGWQ